MKNSGNITVNSIYWLSAITIIIFMAMFIFPQIRVQITNPLKEKTFSGKTANKLSDLQKMVGQQEEAVISKKAEKIMDKIAHGELVSEKDRKFLDNFRKGRRATLESILWEKVGQPYEIHGGRHIGKDFIAPEDGYYKFKTKYPSEIRMFMKSSDDMFIYDGRALYFKKGTGCTIFTSRRNYVQAWKQVAATE